MQKILLLAVVFFATLSVSAATSSNAWVPIYMNGITIFVPYQTGASEVTLEYQYDALGRLIQVKDNGAPKTDYSYDPAGNRVSVSETPAN